MVLWSDMMAPKPDINVFFQQKTMHLMNGVQDPFQVLGPISNPILDIRRESFLNGTCGSHQTPLIRGGEEPFILL